MPILFVTIEHSATMDTLETLGWNKDGSGRPLVELWRWDGQPHPRGDLIVFSHLTDAQMPRILELAATMETHTTQRPIDAIEASWISRGKDLSELDKQIANWAALLVLKPTIRKLEARK